MWTEQAAWTLDTLSQQGMEITGSMDVWHDKTEGIGEIKQRGVGNVEAASSHTKFAIFKTTEGGTKKYLSTWSFAHMIMDKHGNVLAWLTKGNVLHTFIYKYVHDLYNHVRPRPFI